MATYKRWRKGTVHTIKPGEYRVGPVPPESGISGAQKIVSKTQLAPLNFRMIDIYFKLNSVVLPDFQDLLNAVSKINTKFVSISCYVVRPSGDIKKPTFRWVSGPKKLTSEVKSDLAKMIRGTSPITSTLQYGIGKLPMQFAPPAIVAWNFLEV